MMIVLVIGRAWIAVTRMWIIVMLVDAGDDGPESVVIVPGGRRGYTSSVNKGSRARRSRPAAAAAKAGQDSQAASPKNPQPPVHEILLYYILFYCIPL